MDAFSQKLKLIYKNLFSENIDEFTEALIDYHKFEKHRFELNSEKENKKQFFLNRKTVLRRWLLKGTKCTTDFKKSFKYYKISHYQLHGETLFTLKDFQEEHNLDIFEEKIEKFLKKKNKVHIKTDYQYIYYFCEIDKVIKVYQIIQWEKGENNQTIITIKHQNIHYKGTFTLSDENNIFITLRVKDSTQYLLFHDNNDSSCPYIIGTAMGYSIQDNKVPKAQKMIFSTKVLNEEKDNIKFILNETESISAVENRLNLNFEELKVTHIFKYANKLKLFVNFFKRLSITHYQKQFYYRLAFKEFNAIQKLFQKISTQDSYFIYDYQRALLELIETVENIQNIPLQVVMQLKSDNIFLEKSNKSLKIKKKFLNLFSDFNIKTTLIFVIPSQETVTNNIKKLLDEMKKHHIDVYLIEEEKIIQEVNSLDFIFIDLHNKQDFVLADPIRDSKDVYKIFINKVTMEEYRIDYYKILEQSKEWVF